MVLARTSILNSLLRQWLKLLQKNMPYSDEYIKQINTHIGNLLPIVMPVINTLRIGTFLKVNDKNVYVKLRIIYR